MVYAILRTELLRIHMLKLDIKTFRIPLDIPFEMQASFKEPLVFYLIHKDDMRLFFYTFVVVDFQKKELIHIVSYLPENIFLVENHPNSNFFKINSMLANPHSVIQTQKDESFLVFFETAPFFFQIDYSQNILYVHSEKILRRNDNEIVTSFCPTVFKDDTDTNHFFFSVSTMDKITRERNLRFYKSSLNLSEMEEIYSRPTIHPLTPHTTRKISRYLINSNFLNRRIKNLSTGEIFKNIQRYALYVYRSLYKEYCAKENTPYLEDAFRSENSFDLSMWNIRLEDGFAAFCAPRGKNFLEICRKNPTYAFVPMPGTILLIDPKVQKEKTFETTFCSPAHFEIDKKTGAIFVSSHNFTVTDKRHFFGPAAIDRFRLENGELLKISTFSHPTGYRFTSHQIFSYAGKTYICTFGQPNRLFFIDAATMELVFFDDIEMDFISPHTDITHFLNTSELETFTMKALAVSEDGRFIFFLSYDYIYFYSFPERKIVRKIKLNGSAQPSLDNFRNITTHIGLLS